jgi:hypothetical protein
MIENRGCVVFMENDFLIGEELSRGVVVMRVAEGRELLDP